MARAMDAHPSPTLPAILELLNPPKDGRLLAFGASTADHALRLAAERPDLLIIVCDATYEVTRDVSNRATAERLNNLIVGDTPAGPPVDRALFVGSTSQVAPSDLVAMRSAMLPGGYAIFIEEGGTAGGSIARLRELGYTVADELDAVAGFAIIRAR
jgi:hypothetical protein